MSYLVDVKAVFVTAVIFGCTACAWTPTMVESGLAGTAAGAGTGALVGTVIANGDVLASAGLGAAVGLPVGLVLGNYYIDYLEEQKLQEQRLKVVEQQRQIFRNERELEKMREELWADAPIELDRDRRNIYFDGPTLGSYYR